MKFNEIFHLGIVVRDLEKAVKIYEDEMGYGPFEFGDGRFFDDKIVNALPFIEGISAVNGQAVKGGADTAGFDVLPAAGNLDAVMVGKVVIGAVGVHC